jgi:hypothetical protein
MNDFSTVQSALQHIEMDATSSKSSLVTIVNREGYGRVVVATKLIHELGTVVVRERPLLEWTINNWDEYLINLLNSSNETKKQVFDMHIPKEDSKVMQAALRRAMSCLETYARYPALEREFAAQLIGIAISNSHSYSDSQLETLDELIDALSPGDDYCGDTKSALLSVGSRIAHSCLPNVFCCSRTSDGSIEF